ncbi:hypothetical protein [Aurantiacibacter luteus]|uniref:Uncharacterized protein n=1 Tax=Aurantiacibacter luteus TaxID=1581420 RepID=A0A0G9MYU1_9SPHN|nr:hypothetical protein [Aurantiacibacter luteus]KLE34448.1 hypothetical protein AAW00_09505 [Aurantiacibacter luteus]
MEQELAIFAASLAAVAALVALAHCLGFSAVGTVADEADAREALALVPGGFAVQALVLDAEGRSALARDAAGRLAAVVPHGGRLVARVLEPGSHLALDGDTLSIASPQLGPRTVHLTPVDSLPDWARSSPFAS